MFYDDGYNENSGINFYIEIGDEEEILFTDFDEAIEYCEKKFGDDLKSFDWDDVKESKNFYELEAFLDDFGEDYKENVFCYMRN